MKKQKLKLAIIYFFITCSFISLMAQTATKLSIADTRYLNTGPNGFSREVKAEFKTRGTIGVPGMGMFSGLLTIAPWAMMDNSGNKHHQLSFNDGGVFYRTGWPADSTWGTWSKLVIEDVNGKVGIGGDVEINNGKLKVSGSSTLMGNVGIGTATPNTRLHITGNPGSLAYVTTTNGTVSESATILFQGGRGIVGYDGVFQGMRFSVSDASKSLIFTNSLSNGVGEIMRIKGNGNIGIGISNPLYKLDVAGKIQTNDELIVTRSNIDIGGTISLGNGAKTEPGQASVWRIYNMGGSYGNSLQFWAYDNIGCTTGGLCNNRFTIMDDGKVGIGTTTPDEMLTVNGKIHAKEVIVALTGPLADYVFEPDYRLKPLHEVEQFVRTNKHLPGIPSAAQVEEKGLSISEMQNKLLQKVEELTLYIIEQQKQIDQQNEKIRLLENR